MAKTAISIALLSRQKQTGESPSGSLAGFVLMNQLFKRGVRPHAKLSNAINAREVRAGFRAPAVYKYLVNRANFWKKVLTRFLSLIYLGTHKPPGFVS